MAKRAAIKRAKRFQTMKDRFRKAENVFELSPMMKGFFITCNRGREKKCASEVIDLLEAESDSEDEEAGDIESEIARELEDMKSKSKPKLFRSLQTTIDCIAFVKCDKRIDPEDLTQFIGTHGFTSRLIPAKVTCSAKIDAIVGAKLLAEDAEPTTFALAINVRYCDGLKRKDIIPAVAAPFDEKHTVDLENAKYTIVIEAFKSLCAVGLVEDYNKLKRLNLQTLFDEPADKPKATAAAKDTAAEEFKKAEPKEESKESPKGEPEAE
ncbi:hypothetical protein DL89DRAFT_268475 [Linderina pennispora]|uniref:THUMP domain-containing protein n=1 Tax=Linderina pennispora TaxID=61395 RepID=A0A1Y1W5A6_9FUNG|nr:uncharacterized protein DL89DRAFT_268475 [Linderina pennispora]ORX68700.1 hypothetical protein DL89DRAFT_268475 [Linderina pennispora]